MGEWGDAATWTGDGLQREVFFFGLEGSELYGSLYAAQDPSRAEGVVVCSSWGFEADRTDHLAHHLALTMARLGGAGMVFHYPGYGDSRGAYLGDATLASLAQAAATAIEEAARRRPQLAWFPAGLMFGAAVASLAQGISPASAGRLLFVQPTLDSDAYFAPMAQGVQSVVLRSGAVREMSFAYPFPRGMVSKEGAAGSPVGDALAAFEGRGAVLRHERPARDELVPERFAEVIVDGTWRFADRYSPELEAGMAECLQA